MALTGLRITGANAAAARLRNMARRMSNPHGAMDVVAGKAYQEVMRHFSAEEGPEGPWQPFKYGHRVGGRRGRRNRGDKLLQDTGTLRSRIRFTASKVQAIVFTNVKYAGVHQRGSKKNNVPARPFMWVNRDFERTALRMITKYMLEGRL